MPGVNSVAPRTGGLLDTVLKGVAVARDIYGIKHDMAATDAQEQQAAQSATKFKDEQAGIVGNDKFLDYAKDYKVAGPDDTDTIDVKHRAGPSDADVITTRMIPQNRLRTPLQQHVEVSGAMIDGKHGTATYDPAQMKPGDQKSGLLGFVETAKAPGPAVDHLAQIDTTDADGNRVVKFVPKVAGAEYQTTKGAPKSTDQDALYTKLVDKIDNFRGDKAAAQASTNLLSADNALKLANKYPDPDKMGTKDYNLLVDEIGKIATGGVPGQHTQESISASTLESKWSELMATVKGQPTPAQLGEFIKNNIDYLKDLRETSQSVVDAHNIKAFNGMKRSFDDEHIKAFQEDFPDLWSRELARVAKKGAPAQGPAPAAVGGPGMAVGAPSGSGQVKPAAAFHPQADDARKFMEANINSKDPDKRADALKIKKLLDQSDAADSPTPGGGRP